MWAGMEYTTEEDDAQICKECGKLYFGLLGICLACDEKLEREEMDIHEWEERREQ